MLSTSPAIAPMAVGRQPAAVPRLSGLVSQNLPVGRAYGEGMSLREQQRLADALSAFERAVQEQPDHASAWFWLGATKDNLGDEVGAIPAYERALQLGLSLPEKPKAWTWLASSYSIVGRHDEALRALEHAELVGGYEPVDEFVRISDNIRQRSRS